MTESWAPLVLSWALNHFVLGAQLAPGEKRLVCIPVKDFRINPEFRTLRLTLSQPQNAELGRF